MPDTAKESLREALFNRRMLICIFTGFSSGLPLYFLLNLIPAWLRSAHIDLKTIGLMTLIQLPYTWKFLWAPLMDRYRLPPSRRRGWMLLTQIALLACLAAFGLLDPSQDLRYAVYLGAAVAFFSASQDIVLDAYRRELLTDAELGLGNSIHVNAYRLAQLIPGSLALILADHLPWSQVFLITALFMLPGMLMTLVASEPHAEITAPANLRAAVIEPFREFFQRRGVDQALLVIAFVFLYKLGDSMATALATPFYLDMGFSKTEIGLVAKHAGLWCSVTGGIVGGIWMVKLGINRALWLFGVVQVVSILGFAALAQSGHNLWMLAVAVGFEALGVGLGTTALVAYIASNTSLRYAATQFALFTALAALPRSLFNAFSGLLVEAIGWFDFFLLCTLLALPGMLLLFRIAPWNSADDRARP